MLTLCSLLFQGLISPVAVRLMLNWVNAKESSNNTSEHATERSSLASMIKQMTVLLLQKTLNLHLMSKKKKKWPKILDIPATYGLM